MANKFALFFTSGLSDLKFVSIDGTLLELCKFRDSPGDYIEIRDIHQYLLNLEPEDLCIYPFDTDQCPYDKELNKRADISFLKPQDGDTLPETATDRNQTDYPLKYTDDGRLLLVASKMEPVVSFVRDTKATIEAVTGFNSRRDNDPNEPIASEKLLFDAFDRTFKPAYKKLTTYVQGTETIEGAAQTILQRIESSILDCKNSINKTNLCKPLLANSGGIPGSKEIIRKAIELHFGPVLSKIKPSDNDTASFYVTTPDYLSARINALGFIRQGAIVNASATLIPYADDRIFMKQWVRPLHYAALFFDGNPVSTFYKGLPPHNPRYRWESAAPPDFLQQLAEIIFKGPGKPQRRSLLAGLRAEAALRTGRWIEAINLTLTFHDAARRDFIEKYFDASIDNHLQFTTDYILDEKETDYLLNKKYGFDKRPCLEYSAGIYTINSSRERDRAWSEFIGGPLKGMEKVLSTSQPGTNTLRHFRNNSTHNILDAKTLDEGIKLFEQSGLWVRKKPDNSLSLLDADILGRIISDLGFNSGNILDWLCNQLEKILLTPPKLD